MSDENGSKLNPEVKQHRTLETYRALLEAEVKNLFMRVGVIAQTQDDLLVSVNEFALNLEEVIGVMERLETSRDYFRDEISALHKATQQNEEYSKELLSRLRQLQERLNTLEKSC